MSLRIPQTILLMVLASMLTACAVNPVTGRKELALVAVSQQEEIEIGTKTFPQVLQKMGGVYQDPNLEAYINRVGTKLGKISQRPDLPYQFKVVNDSSPNAFALPGGFIAISRGLLVNLDNEAQLASVLGHEIGHVTARHSVQGMQRGTLLNAGLAIVSGVTGQSAFGPLAQQAGQLTASLIDNTYSRDQESEADLLGIDYMVTAKYDPVGAVQLQEYFYRQVEGGANPVWLTGLFRTHPFSKERMEANEDYVRSRYANTLNNPGYTLGAPSFQQATAAIQATKEGYALYDQARQQERKGDLNGAISTYLQAAAKAPDQALILTGLGMAYLRAEDRNSARQHLSRAVQLDPDYYESQVGLGYVLLEDKQAAKAVTHLEKSMALLPTAQGAYLLAEGYQGTGQNAKALELYRAVAQADPNGSLGKSAAQKAAQLERRQ